MKKLGVNIDHVATLRQARGTEYPDPVEAALLCEDAGADSIVAHLREDRRHINDDDVRRLKEKIMTRLNLEMSIDKEIVSIALDLSPSQVTFVPEHRKELTTEGGLDVIGKRGVLEQIIRKFKDRGIIVSLFVDPQKSQVLVSHKIGADCVEIHTGVYADTYNKEAKKTKDELKRLKEIASYCKELGIVVHAGHGLNYDNVRPIARVEEFDELNIGHSIISKAIYVGMKKAVSMMKELLV